MKILISESQYNRVLFENSLDLSEGGRQHYEERKERIQETLNVIFEYSGPGNLINVYGKDSIPKIFNPRTTTLDKFVKPNEKMRFGDAYVVGKFTLSDDEYFGILEKLEFLEENFEKFLSKNPEQSFILTVHEYNLNPPTSNTQQSNFSRINFVDPELEKQIGVFFKKSKRGGLFIANEGDSPSVGDNIMVMIQHGDLDTLINDRERDLDDKFKNYVKISFKEFKKGVDKIKEDEEAEERKKTEFAARINNIKNEKPEPEPKKKSIRKPKDITGYFKLLDDGIEKEVFYLYDVFKNVQQEKEVILNKYKDTPKYNSKEMADEIVSLGIPSLRNKIKSTVSSNLDGKLGDSFIDMFDTEHPKISKSGVNEDYFHVNTKMGVIRLTENQFKTISHLL